MIHTHLIVKWLLVCINQYEDSLQTRNDLIEVHDYGPAVSRLHKSDITYRLVNNFNYDK